MSDPTLVNKVYGAGRAAALAGAPERALDDPIVTGLLVQLGVRAGDQYAADITAAWDRGFAEALSEMEGLA